MLRCVRIDILAVAAMMIWGCGNDMPTSPDGGDTVGLADAGRDGGGSPVDAGLVDAGPTYPIEHPCEEPCAIRWRELAPFVQPIDHHTTFVLEREDGAYLYVLGGIETDGGGGVSSWNARLSAARIQEDGTLGEWEHEPFNYGLAFHAQTHLIQGMLWIGGVMNDASTADLTPQGNGLSLIADFPPGAGPGIAGVHIGGTPPGAITRLAHDLPAPVLHGAAVMLEHDSQRTAFLIGGSRGTTLTDEVLRYDDDMGWVSAAPLPTERSHHALVTIDERIYIVGGFSGTTLETVGEPAILRSTRDADGNLSGWEEVGTMDDPPATASAFVRDDFVYVIGGSDSGSGGGGHHGDGVYVDRIRRAPLTEDGHVGPFEDVGHLPMARAHVHQTPVSGDYVYSVGGRIMDGSGFVTSDRVFVGTIATP